MTTTVRRSFQIYQNVLCLQRFFILRLFLYINTQICNLKPTDPFCRLFSSKTVKKFFFSASQLLFLKIAQSQNPSCWLFLCYTLFPKDDVYGRGIYFGLDVFQQFLVILTSLLERQYFSIVVYFEHFFYIFIHFYTICMVLNNAPKGSY